MKLLTTTLTVVSATLTALVLWSSAHNDQLAGQPYLVINMDTTPHPVQNAEVKAKVEGRFLRASSLPSTDSAPSEPERQSSNNQSGDDMVPMDQQQGNSQAEQEAIRRNQEELMRAFQ